MGWQHAGIRKVATRFLREVDLPEDDRALLRDFIAAEMEVDLIPSEDPRASQVFLRLERVFAARPVDLAGEEVPSLAHNRLTLHLGSDDPETGERVPGPALLSCLLSERALSSLMMRPNRGDPDVAMTAEAVLGTPVPEPRRDDGSFLLSALEAGLDSVSRRPLDLLQVLRKTAVDSRLPFSRKALECMKTLLQRDPLSRGDFAFILERHVENLQKRNVASRVEAAHTVLHADRVLEAIDNPAIEGSVGEVEFSPLARALLQDPDDRLADLLVAACQHYVARRLQAWGVSPDDFPDGLARSDFRLERALSHGGCAEPKQVVAEISSVLQARDGFLRSMQRPKEGRRPPQLLTASLSHVQGVSGGGHSDLVTTGNAMIRLSISRAEETEGFGNKGIRETSQIAEIEMTPEDAVLLLRGHPDGGGVRCNLLRLTGRRVEQAPHVNAFQAEISATSGDPDLADPEVDRIWRELRRRVEKGISRKAEKEDLLNLLDALEARLSDSVEERCETVREKARLLEDMAREDLRGALSSLQEHRLLDLLSGAGRQEAGGGIPGP